MCGFYGVVGSKPRFPLDVERILESRGPDSRGVFDAHNLWAVHRRLAIVDTSPRSGQPFVAPDGSVLLYNGEIYNYREFETRLPNRITTGDTEVVAHLGADVESISQFRGIFAYALVKPDGTVILVRDRFGTKPLYFRLENESIYFSSQIRALLTDMEAPKMSGQGMSSFLNYGSVLDDSIIEGVQQVGPGEILTWKSGQIQSRTRVAATRPAESLSISSALRQSVRRNLEADVPTCILMSGGLDSAILAKLSSDDAIERPLAVTLSIDGELDESERAAKTCKHYGLKHEIVRVSRSEIADSVPAYLDAMDQPTIDGLNTFLITNAVRRVGLKVALSGLGSDEIFGGYGLERRLFLLKLAKVAPKPLVSRLLRKSQRVNSEKVDDFLNSVSQRHNAMRITRTIRPDSELDEMGLPIIIEPKFHQFTGDEVIDFTFGHYMIPTLLRDADNFSMANSVELRVPFLDDDLVYVASRRTEMTRALRKKSSVARSLSDSFLLDIAKQPKTGFSLDLPSLVDELRKSVPGFDLRLRPEKSWQRFWSAYVLSSYARRFGLDH